VVDGVMVVMMAVVVVDGCMHRLGEDGEY